MNLKQYEKYAAAMGYKVVKPHFKNAGTLDKPIIASVGTWVRSEPKNKVGRGARKRAAKRALAA